MGLNRAVLEELAAAAPGRCAVYTPDVSDGPAMQAMAQDWMARFGVPDAVIANAGVAGGYDTAEASDLAVFRRMLEINLLGVATTFQPFVAPMRARGRGMLAGIASIAGRRGMPGNGAYCASKGGLIRYLESLRAELRPQRRARVHREPRLPAHRAHGRQPLRHAGPDGARGGCRAILRALARGREQLVLPRRIGWLSSALDLLPDAWHDALLLRQPRKPRAGEAGATPFRACAPAAGARAPPSNPHLDRPRAERAVAVFHPESCSCLFLCPRPCPRTSKSP